MTKYGSYEVKGIDFNSQQVKRADFNGSVCFQINNAKVNVKLTVTSNFYRGSSGSYDQCGETYGWVDVTYSNKVTASVTGTKAISSWSLKFNGPMETWLQTWRSTTGKQEFVAKGTVLTNSNPTSPVKNNYFYARTDYQDSGQVDRVFDTYSTDNSLTITVNFTDGTSGSKTFDMGFMYTQDSHYMDNITLSDNSGDMQL